MPGVIMAMMQDGFWPDVNATTTPARARRRRRKAASRRGAQQPATIELGGKPEALSEVLRRHGISRNAFNGRIHLGWDLVRAATTPIRKGDPSTVSVTFRLKAETVEWLRKWGVARKKSLNEFAQEVIHCVRLHGGVPRGQRDELEVDRAAHKYDPIDYQNHVFWRRAQQVEDNKAGWDRTSRTTQERWNG
jgi:hypothetical protein